MWEINSTSNNYVTITNQEVTDHFYVSGSNTDNVTLTADAIREAMNNEKKNNTLKLNIRINGELAILQNQVKIGTSGPIKKAAGYQFHESEISSRQILLDKLMKYCC